MVFHVLDKTSFNMIICTHWLPGNQTAPELTLCNSINVNRAVFLYLITGFPRIGRLFHSLTYSRHMLERG